MNIATSTNHFVETKNYFLEAFDYGQKGVFFKKAGPLVVTFENLDGPKSKAGGFRKGWGVDPLRKKGISHIAVKPKAPNWYRKPDLTEAFGHLRSMGFFDKFERIITYGASMGGYGALAYADILQADTVICLNPQSTMNPALVPWEQRFPRSRVENWKKKSSDAALGCRNARQIYAFVDRMHLPDWKHIERLSKHNLHVMNVPFVAHGVPIHLLKCGVLPMIVSELIEKDNFNRTVFYKKIRYRREIPKYYLSLKKMPRVQNSELFTSIVNRFEESSISEAKP